MKKPPLIWLILVAAAWSCFLTFTRAQESAAPIPPPPPPAPAQRSSPRPANPPTQSQLLPADTLRTSSGSLVYLDKNASQAVWTSPALMNNYYVGRYVLSSGTVPMAGIPTMNLVPSLRLVLGQQMILNGAMITTAQAYRVDTLELIGLAKHDTPVAYTVNRHSQMEDRGSGFNSPPPAPVTMTGIRPLTDFEKTALDKIKAGQDAAELKSSDGSLFVVGPIRAQAVCLNCHSSYKEGDALGAFSYRLSSVNLFEPTTSDKTVTVHF